MMAESDWGRVCKHKTRLVKVHFTALHTKKRDLQDAGHYSN